MVGDGRLISNVGDQQISFAEPLRVSGGRMSFVLCNSRSDRSKWPPTTTKIPTRVAERAETDWLHDPSLSHPTKSPLLNSYGSVFRLCLGNVKWSPSVNPLFPDRAVTYSSTSASSRRLPFRGLAENSRSRCPPSSSMLLLLPFPFSHYCAFFLLNGWRGHDPSSTLCAPRWSCGGCYGGFLEKVIVGFVLRKECPRMSYT
jgi:hypothetical protein